MNSLSEQQIADIRKRLRARHAELREQIRQELLRSDEQHYLDLATAVHDTGEESVADLLSDLDIALIDRHVNEIRDVEEALQRIATGVYGICADCGGEVGYERLSAYPTAQRCYSCQQRHEQGFAEEGRPKL
ncbi:MAG: TraR/DksA family transcriptional regulator [Pseudomonadota bacterium]